MVRATKCGAIGVWFLSSIGANAPQLTLTLNFGGRGFVYLCLSKFLMQKHVHHISWNLSANGCHTLEQHEQHAVGKTHSQWLEFHFDHPESPERASFRFELQNTLWEQNSKDWSMDINGLYRIISGSWFNMIQWCIMMGHDGSFAFICDIVDRSLAAKAWARLQLRKEMLFQAPGLAFVGKWNLGGPSCGMKTPGPS